ncbi:DUF883 family protein [Yoonia sp. 2307UL14-13]|uniref:DUF883 family protein n=1 Tax=Yoonia sp. 2307UL14-13 TaxID=3126506 RepID=UPI0030AAC9E6
MERNVFARVCPSATKRSFLMATKATNGKVSNPSPGDLTDQIAVIRDDITALTQMMADMGKDKAGEAADAVRSQAADAQQRLSEHADTARQHAADMQGHANDFVRNQPATALGIAAGLGFLFGYLGSRR